MTQGHGGKFRHFYSQDMKVLTDQRVMAWGIVSRKAKASNKVAKAPSDQGKSWHSKTGRRAQN